MNLHRHGELVLKEIKAIPKKAKLVEVVGSKIVAHSESGHHHVLTTPGLRVYELDNEMYLEVQNPGQLEHQKQSVDRHQTQVIAPAKYKVIIKREFNYFEKAMRRVVD